MRHVRTRCQRKRNAMMCRNLQMPPNVRKRVRSLGNELVPSPAIIAKAQGGMVGQYVFFLKCVRAAKNIE
jgi:hypothetical protein